MVDFSKETLDGKAAEFAPGAWVFGDIHFPGGLRNMKVNNRAFGFKLTLQNDIGDVKKGEECLFLYGLGNKNAIEGVKELEKTTGLKAVALLCNGSAHHTFIKFWYDAFPDLRVWVAPTKVPTTSNGKFLIKNYPDRWELADNSSVPHHVNQLFHYFGSGDDIQVDCVLFNQFFIYKDTTSSSVGVWNNPNSEPKLQGNLYPFTQFGTLTGDKSQPLDEPIFFHKSSKLIITGHHVEFVYKPVGYCVPDPLKFEGGFVWTKLVASQFTKPGRYQSCLAAQMGRINDPKIHSDQWHEVMKWDFEYATGHHDYPTVCGPQSDDAIMKGEGGLKGYLKRELTRTGELDNTPEAGSCLGKSDNELQIVLKAEPKFKKQYGKTPAIRYGGPGYDKFTGLKK